MFHPLTGNTTMEIVVSEPFYYEEDGVGDMLTLVSGVMIDSPQPEIYCRRG